MTGLPEQPVRSYTQLTQLEECGEQYRLKRIERVPERPAVWFPAGNAVHGVTEAFDRHAVEHGPDNALAINWAATFPQVFTELREELIERKGADPDVSTWRTAGRPTKALPNGEDIPWWNVHGPVMVRDYIEWRVRHRDRYAIWVAPDGNPGIEWEGVAELGGVKVTMKADRILVDQGTGATIIVDLKSGKRKPDNPLQLRIYRMVIERVTAEPMWYGAYFMTREASLTTPVVLDTTNEWAIEERFARAELAIQAGIFTPRPSADNCTQCAFRDICQFVEG